MRKHQRFFYPFNNTEVYAYYYMDKKALFFNTNFAGNKIRKIVYV